MLLPTIAALPLTLVQLPAAPAPEGARSPLVWGDFDADGLSDAVLLRPGEPVRLFLGLPEGGLLDATEAVGLAGFGEARSALWHDVDGDLDQDLFLLAPRGSGALFLNRDGHLDATGPETGLDLAGVVFAAFVDLDADGRADLHVATSSEDRIYRSLGAARFERVFARPLALAPSGGVPAAGATPPSASSTAPGAAPGGAPIPASTGLCLDWITDQATGACLTATSLPEQGSLYPLGRELFIDPTGLVGVNTLTPAHQLDVEGNLHVSKQIISSVALQPPLVVSSNALVANLNADKLDGWEADDFSQLGDTIETAELADLAVTASKLATGAVTSSKVAVGAISDAKVSSGAAIQGSKIVPDFDQDVTTTGSMGVGTTAPKKELQVTGPGSYSEVLVNPDGPMEGSRLVLARNASGLDGFALSQVANSDQFQLRTYENGVASQIVFWADDDGNAAFGNHMSESTRLTVQKEPVDARAVYARGVDEQALYASTTSNDPDNLCVEVRSWGEGTALLSFAEKGYALYGRSNGDYGASAGVYGRHSTDYGGTGVLGISVGYYGRGVEGEATSTTGYAYGVRGECSSTNGYGVLSSGDFAASGAKGFLQPHPTDPSKEIRFLCLEGNESGTYFRGTARLEGGIATIDVPEEFRWVSDEDGLTVQVTPLGPGNLWVSSKGLDEIVVQGTADVEFDYFVNGVRRGYRDVEILRENRSFVPEERGVPYGTQYPDAYRRILVESGILNDDFTPNEATAAALGWELREPADDDEDHEVREEEETIRAADPRDQH